MAGQNFAKKPKKAKGRRNNNDKDLSTEDNAYEALFNGELGSLDIGNYISKDGGDNEATEHLPDAIDFEDEDELADDDDELDMNNDSNKGINNVNLPHTEINNNANDIVIHSNMIDQNDTLDNNNNLGNDISSGLITGNNSLLMEDVGFVHENDNNNALFMGMLDNNNPSNLSMNDNNINSINNLNMLDNNGQFVNTTTSFDIFDTNNQLNNIQLNNNQIITNQIDNSNIIPINDKNVSNNNNISNNNNNIINPNISIIDKETLLKRKQERDRALLKYYFPSFKKGKVLKWNKFIYRKKLNYIFYSSIDKPKRNNNNVSTIFYPVNVKFKVQQDQKRIFNTMDYSNILQESSKKLKNFGIKTVSIDDIYPETLNENEEVKEKNLKIDKNDNDVAITDDLLIATDDWDEYKILGENSDSETENKVTARTKSNDNQITKIIKNNFGDEDSSKWDWDEDDLVDAKLNYETAQLDMNDSKLLLLYEDPKRKSPIKQLKEKIVLSTSKPINESFLLQKYNISNDQAYSILKHTHQPRIRATISNLNIEHSQPAINLQSPFYKVSIPKHSLRFFHKPDFGQQIRHGSIITFNKLKTRKRKRDKGKSVKESFATSQDLTLGDTAPIYLMEYSEQNPLALSKFGMANKLINYYRKINENDTLRPKLAVGETHVLGVQDKSPFWNFGFVEPGHIVPTLYNNMVRAPVFKHDVSNTDFLLIRSTGNGINNKFYLKNINHLFTVGQTFPVVEIPGPNSRKVTSMKSTRLRMVVYRILNKTTSKAISIEPISKHFPDQDYGQNRQKIKEFMKYQREGVDKGLWKLKEGEPLLANENTKKLISPEQVSEVESMNYGLQTLEDNENYNFDEKLAKLEENLLPWNTTKNFINATQMRAMVQIHGVGDPTGCGEGFSFLKTSMKGGFIKSNANLNANKHKNLNGKDKLDNGKNNKGTTHTYNVVEQQKAYDAEIIKTWYRHAKSLSITNPFEEMDDPDMGNVTNLHGFKHRDDDKVLRVTRKKRDENGIIQRETIIIRDPRVIKGYLRGKERRKEAKIDVTKLLEEDTNNISNVEDLEIQKKILQNELASLEKAQQRRAARQSSRKRGSDGGKISKVKNSTRRCATCGQVGHIRTNKSCPMYNANNNGNDNKNDINIKSENDNLSTNTNNNIIDSSTLN